MKKYGSMEDKNQNNYKTVVIGTQTWMAKNLIYRTSNSKCHSDNSDCDKYGRLYNFNDANEACPSDWHLPSDEDWNNLKNYVEQQESCNDCIGKYLKTIGNWGNGEDKYGFAALPGGGHTNDTFYDVGTAGYWWSATYANQPNDPAYYWKIDYDDRLWTSSYNRNNYLFSVRCIKDN